MYCRLFLVSALLSYFTGESLVHGLPEMVLAFAGEDVILPCSYNITGSDDFPTVEWSKDGLQPNVIFLYRDGCETHEMKNPSFQYRTSFISQELKNRNISLRISNVQLSDAGTYQCMRLWKNAPRDITTVELVVGAVSEPKLSVVSAESAGVTLQCEVDCWLPEPEIKFLDDQGNDILAHDPKRRQHASGCYTVTRRVTLQDATSSVACRVQQPQINQTRNTEILIPVDCMRSCLLPTGLTAGGTALLLLGFFGLTVLSWKRFGASVGGEKGSLTRQSSDESTLSSAYDDNPLLQSIRIDRPDSAGSNTIERLTREVADLKSKLHQKQMIILQLQSDNRSPLSPAVGQPPMVCNPAASTNSRPPEPENLPQRQGSKPATSRRHSNPASGGPTQRNLGLDSSPVVFNWSLPANTSKRKLSSQSVRESSWPSTEIFTVQRRHSSAPLSTNNRFSLLANFTEET